jgi:16S rRNA (cytosine1402-N4)-methyltransferase
MSIDVYHVPVMLAECVEGLNIEPGGIYVDVTYGGGGHSKAIAGKLTTGKLIAFDRDADAIHSITTTNQKLIVIHSSFSNLTTELNRLNITAVDGLLADLGVSSHQFDEASRGFSFRFNSDLDMRMDNRDDVTAADILNTYSEEKLWKIFSLYGEIRNSKTVAKAIVNARHKTAIKTTFDLKAAVQNLVPAKDESKFYAQLFQALRIVVNSEMQELESLLTQLPAVIKQGGRLCIMSYHSLEDRMVKNFIASGNISGEQEKDLYGNVTSKTFVATHKKAIEPQPEELTANPRSRSARLRIAEKI